jgi:predicted dehydrogenase
LEGERLTLTSNAVSSSDHIHAAGWGISRPDTTTTVKTFAALPSPHLEIIRNFVEAIGHGTPLIAPGAQGANSLELANAILHSGLSGQPVSLPLDAAAYERALLELIEKSRLQNKTPL